MGRGHAQAQRRMDGYAPVFVSLFGLSPQTSTSSGFCTLAHPSHVLPLSIWPRLHLAEGVAKMVLSLSPGSEGVVSDWSAAVGIGIFNGLGRESGTRLSYVAGSISLTSSKGSLATNTEGSPGSVRGIVSNIDCDSNLILRTFQLSASLLIEIADDVDPRRVPSS